MKGAKWVMERAILRLKQKSRKRKCPEEKSFA
jgi:hypothetical protein